VLGITRADQLPSVSGTVATVTERIPQGKLNPPLYTSAHAIGLSMFWELDFWGKFRRATEAARADLLATEWGKRAVMTTLVANVAGSYLQLRELDLQLEIAQRTLGTRQESLRLVEIRANGGTTSMLDVRQSEQLVYGAAGAIPDLERQIEQQENFISVLLGQNPGPIKRGGPLTATRFLPVLPAGLPSSLLERRPDIQVAEQQMVSANARIGVAKAAYFPSIALTASGGYQSSALLGLFTSPAGIWSLAASAVQPIFQGGRLRANVRLSEARQQEAVAVYRQTVQQSFREVSDSLIAYQKNQEFRKQQELLTASAGDAVRLSNMRYEGGVTSYLEVLDSDTRYFQAQNNLAQAQLNELLSVVQLYRALGGGWEQQ
jgi:multidrug efflux system outer membrane protein